MSDTAERRIVPLNEAIARIGEEPEIHTFMQTGPMLIGADHPREELIAAMRAHGVEESGPAATAMKHSLVIVAYPTTDGRTTALFIEARLA